jgi:hypothetical protein
MLYLQATSDSGHSTGSPQVVAKCVLDARGRKLHPEMNLEGRKVGMKVVKLDGTFWRERFVVVFWSGRLRVIPCATSDRRDETPR